MNALARADVPWNTVPRHSPLFLVRDNSSFAAIADDDAEDEVLTARELAAMLRMHPKKVYELAIPQVRLSPGRVRWLKSDVRAYIRRQRVGR